MDYDFTVIVKQFVAPLEFWKCVPLWKRLRIYLTLDNYHKYNDQVDTATSEMPDEHKSFNLLQLEMVSFVSIQTMMSHIYINDPSETSKYDFKVSTRVSLRLRMMLTGVVYIVTIISGLHPMKEEE